MRGCGTKAPKMEGRADGHTVAKPSNLAQKSRRTWDGWIRAEFFGTGSFQQISVARHATNRGGRQFTNKRLSFKKQANLLEDNLLKKMNFSQYVSRRGSLNSQVQGQISPCYSWNCAQLTVGFPKCSRRRSGQRLFWHCPNKLEETGWLTACLQQSNWWSISSH